MLLGAARPPGNTRIHHHSLLSGRPSLLGFFVNILESHQGKMALEEFTVDLVQQVIPFRSPNPLEDPREHRLRLVRTAYLDESY